MPLSVVMTLCLLASDGSTSCTVSGRAVFKEAPGEEVCSELANAAINNRLLELGKEGFAYGTCTQRSSYVSVTNAAVKFLKSKGYKVSFQAYKE